MPSIPFTGMPLQLKKMYAGPLTDDQVFDSIESAEAFAASPSAYPGAPITVRTTNDSGQADWSLYVVQDDKSLKLVSGGSGVSKDEIQNIIQETFGATIEEINNSIENIKTSIGDAGSNAESAKNTAEEANTTANEALTTVNNMNNTVEQHSTDITELKNTTQKVEADTTQLRQDVNTNIENINNNTTNINEIKTAITWQVIRS